MAKTWKFLKGEGGKARLFLAAFAKGAVRRNVFLATARDIGGGSISKNIFFDNFDKRPCSDKVFFIFFNIGVSNKITGV